MSWENLYPEIPKAAAAMIKNAAVCQVMGACSLNGITRSEQRSSRHLERIVQQKPTLPEKKKPEKGLEELE